MLTLNSISDRAFTELFPQRENRHCHPANRQQHNAQRKVVVTLRKTGGSKVRILPAFAAILPMAKHAVNMIREVEIGDLLRGREIVTPDKQLMEANTSGKVVMLPPAAEERSALNCAGRRRPWAPPSWC